MGLGLGSRPLLDDAGGSRHVALAHLRAWRHGAAVRHGQRGGRHKRRRGGQGGAGVHGRRSRAAPGRVAGGTGEVAARHQDKVAVARGEVEGGN